MEDLKNILESLLFVAEEALSVERLKKLVGEADGAEIRQALAALQADYDSRRGGFYLAEVAGGFQFRTRPEYTAWIRRLIEPRPVRLSKAALETLAIIAYKQPVIRTDVEHIRGVDCGGVLRQLLERKLVRVLGRKEIAGRPLIYATTKRFLETFDLKDLKDLPTPREIEDFGKAPLEGRGNVTIEPDEEASLPAQIAEAPPAEELMEADASAADSEAQAPEQAENVEESVLDNDPDVERAEDAPAEGKQPRPSET
jgi:segregation and condensation protein B